MAVLVVSFWVIGAFSVRNSMFDVTAMIGFGIAGYALRKNPLPLALVMGATVRPEPPNNIGLQHRLGATSGLT